MVGICAMQDLDKSMTRHEQHQIWQDVYKPTYGGQDLYVKLQVIADKLIVISFKER